MDVTSITFGIKDVVAIVGAVISVVSFIFAMKHSNDKNNSRLDALNEKLDDTKKDMDEKFLHAKNAKKANIMSIYEEIARNREDFKEKELQIYAKIEDIREEQKASHEKMSGKLDTLSTTIANMNTNLAELTGYIRAKKEDKM